MDLGPNWTEVAIALLGVVGSIVALISNYLHAEQHRRDVDMLRARLDSHEQHLDR